MYRGLAMYRGCTKGGTKRGRLVRNKMKLRGMKATAMPSMAEKGVQIWRGGRSILEEVIVNDEVTYTRSVRR